MKSETNCIQSFIRFFTGKGCMITLQVVVILLAVQMIMIYSGFSLLTPRKLFSLVNPSSSSSSRNWMMTMQQNDKVNVRGTGRKDRSSSRRSMQSSNYIDITKDDNTIFNPPCALFENDMHTKFPSPMIDIAVISTCDAKGRRDAIRNGWGKFAMELGIRWRFFVGLPSADDFHCETSMGAEQRKHSDIVILPLVDTYENLTQKVMGMITYTAKCGRGEFYAKADDDVFVYPWRLIQRLKNIQNDTTLNLHEYSMGIYLGNFWIDARPIKEEWHKNHEFRWMGGYFPPYAGGPFYVLSRPAIEFVLQNSRKLNWKWRNEDMAVGTWMAGTDVKIIQDYHVKLLNWKHHERPYIAEHAIDPENGVEHWHEELHRNFSKPGL